MKKVHKKPHQKQSTAVYVRVSTEEQATEGYSIRGQTEKLKSYALLKEWDIFDVYADEGISGKNIVDRPEINRLIEDIKNNHVKNVLVFKVDRLTRSTKNLLELVDLFEDYNCAFNSLTESIDTDTPSGRMFLKIIGIFAEFERENIGERSKVGKERKAREGYTIACGTISYGYNRENGQKIQTVHEGEAVIVKEIFSMFIDKNYSLNQIARTLNDRGVPTKKGTNVWSSASTRAVLMNPNYIGKVRFAIGNESKYFEADGHHERIISDEVFELAQRKIHNTPRKSRTKTPREESYFCGVLVCSRCDAMFTTHNYRANDSTKPYTTSYRCRTKKSCSSDKCDSPNITHSKVEAAFCEYIQNINNITETDVDIEPVANAEQKLLKSIVDSEKKLKKLQTRKNQVMEQYMEGTIEFDEYKSMIKVYNKKFDVLENELQRKRSEMSDTAAVDVSPEDIITDIRQNWERLSNSEKSVFVQRFVKSITVTTEKESGNSSVVGIDGVEFYGEV